MITRAYLSIGDVLTLLREEFPDVTISKIRFLESQGLVNPERSPSGYRKFYEQDVERLRWVLRQQREHFLPLKVIRDRLAQEDGESMEISAPPAAIAALLQPTAAGTSAPPAPSGERIERENGIERAARLVHTPSTADAAVSPSPSAAPRPLAPLHQATTLHPHGAADGRGPAGDEARTAPSPVLDADPPARQRAQRPSEPSAPAAAPAPPAERAAPAPAPLHPPVSAEPPSSPPPSSSPPSSAGVSGASMTLEELCAASGLGPAEIASLEGFGLIEGIPVGGVLCYDEEALVVAKLVAEFGRYGIEPRHLRLYRNAVEREVGLIEQIVTPLLRQRNPEARQRAVDASGDLARLGEGLRSALLRREMHRLLGH
ncbi:MAG: MerR family transcriptional regulator [Acidimicrobiales bacterium]